MSFLSQAAAARLLGVSTRTVQRWTDDGKLQAAETTRGGHRRYLPEDVQRLLDSWSEKAALEQGAEPTPATYPWRADESGAHPERTGTFHPFVQAVADFYDRFAGFGGDISMKGSGMVTIRVVPELRERALRLANAILVNSLERGYPVVANKGGVDIWVGGAAFELVVNRVTPRVTTDRTSWDLGFTFRLDKRNVGTWRDTRLTPVEGFIPEAIATIEALAPAAGPIQQERIRSATTARLAWEEDKIARRRMRRRAVERPKHIMKLARQLDDARALQALAEHLGSREEHPRILQMRQDISDMARGMMKTLTPKAVEADLELLDLYDETPER